MRRKKNRNGIKFFQRVERIQNDNETLHEDNGVNTF